MTEFTFEEMTRRLKEHFEEEEYEVEERPVRFGGVRVPLYCYKSREGKVTDEIVVDITISPSISIEEFFPKRKEKGRDIVFSSLKFYEYYFHKAKVFLAYPYYAENRIPDKFEEFKDRCETEGIGLLRVDKSKIEMVLDGHSLLKENCKKIFDAVKPYVDNLSKKKNQILEEISKNIQDYMEDAEHTLIIYGDAEYKRRAITEREGELSLLLLDKLRELRNIEYKEELKELARNYRHKSKKDYDIALDIVKKLWSMKKVKDKGYAGIGVEYPEIQRQLEEILLRDPRYRDHFIHQFQVFLLGAYILDKLYDDKGVKRFNNMYNCPIEKAWLITSTYHDFNYSIQQYDIWIKEFFQKALCTDKESDLSPLRLDAEFVRESFLLKTRELCKALNCEMDHDTTMFFYEKTTHKEGRNHGLLSALSLLKLFENNDKRSKISYSAVIQAALAIALHEENVWKPCCGQECAQPQSWDVNFAKKQIIKKLKFKNSPLCFLLIFCDAVQEWGRPGRDYEEIDARLEDFRADSKDVWCCVSLKTDSAFKEKVEEIDGIRRVLQDDRFKIKLESREGAPKGLNVERSMKGK